MLSLTFQVVASRELISLLADRRTVPWVIFSLSDCKDCGRTLSSAPLLWGVDPMEASRFRSQLGHNNESSGLFAVIESIEGNPAEVAVELSIKTAGPSRSWQSELGYLSDFGNSVASRAVAFWERSLKNGT